MAGAPSIATDLKTTLSSSINNDGCGDRSVDRCDPDNYRITSSKSRWTNEKHDAYLDSLERSFIRQLSHSMMSKGGQIHEGHRGYNRCTGAGGICRDPDQAIYSKEAQVKPEIIESRLARTFIKGGYNSDEGRHLDIPSSLQHSPKQCHTSFPPCSGNDFSGISKTLTDECLEPSVYVVCYSCAEEHSGQNF